MVGRHFNVIEIESRKKTTYKTDYSNNWGFNADLNTSHDESLAS
jgi:hypothetical protein